MFAKFCSLRFGSNPLFKCLFCCIQCCLKCCQCIFDKINKEGFIFTTIYGTAYCYSSFTALKLLIHNVGRTVMIEGVSKYTELFGRLAISGLATGLSVLIMKYYLKGTVSPYIHIQKCSIHRYIQYGDKILL